MCIKDCFENCDCCIGTDGKSTDCNIIDTRPNYERGENDWCNNAYNLASWLTRRSDDTCGNFIRLASAALGSIVSIPFAVICGSCCIKKKPSNAHQSANHSQQVRAQDKQKAQQPYFVRYSRWWSPRSLFCNPPAMPMEGEPKARLKGVLWVLQACPTMFADFADGTFGATVRGAVCLVGFGVGLMTNGMCANTERCIDTEERIAEKSSLNGSTSFKESRMMV